MAVADARDASWRVAHRNLGYGHLYQGRFKNFTVQDEHLLTVLRFVERSALSARLVATAEDLAHGVASGRE